MKGLIYLSASIIHRKWSLYPSMLLKSLHEAITSVPASSESQASQHRLDVAVQCVGDGSPVRCRTLSTASTSARMYRHGALTTLGRRIAHDFVRNPYAPCGAHVVLLPFVRVVASIILLLSGHES